MKQLQNTEYIVLVPVLLVLLGMTFAICVDAYLGRKNKRGMLIITALIFTLVLQNAADYLLDINGANRMIRTIVSVYGYSVRPVILILFIRIVNPKCATWPFWALAGVNALIHLTAFFSKICFRITIRNDFYRGPLGYTCHVVSAILLLCLFRFTLREYRRVKKAEAWIPILNTLLVLIAVVADSVIAKDLTYPLSFLTMAIVSCSLFYYIWLHLQFVREHERALQAEQRIRIMMTQIQPHFLFNALNTIRALYAKDPPLADRTLEDFSTYLRQNLESLNQTDLVPITKELEHTRLYAEIESLRFPNIRVEYRIEDAQFEIPALTIQPLVENAIRHGVRGRDNGSVIVSTAREADAHRVTVRDNGVGFDPQRKAVSEESHVGIRNVKERVEQMCGGTMLLESEPGSGTSVTLLIPEGSKSDGRAR